MPRIALQLMAQYEDTHGNDEEPKHLAERDSLEELRRDRQ
jgi:hypothetical protein